jgi:outer membrane protein OmpA-like peptidoglycan-associated protein
MTREGTAGEAGAGRADSGPVAGARRRLASAALLLAAVAASGCAGANASGAARVGEAERMRAGLRGREAEALAPQAFAAADQELRLAREAQAAGDATGAELRADRALAAYNHAVLLARLAHASQDEATASEALTRASTEAQRYTTQRKSVDHEVDDLEKKLRVAREAQLPPSSGPADPERERARVVAATSLVTQARLLCSAARLVSAQAPGLAEAEAAVAALEKQADARAAVAIDPAARTRAACLTSLTKARRATSDADQADTLLGELSQSADPKSARRGGDLAPARDERGVVVTLRGAWKGDKLTPEAEASAKELGRVAAAHPTFAVQVVVHDATAPGATEAAANERRGEALVRALVEGGAPPGKVKVEQAGAKTPVVDPKDARHRERNARVEVVFVSPGG